MRTIERTRQFNREAQGRHRGSIDDSLVTIIKSLAQDQPLDRRHHDQSLSGGLADYRDCHGKPDRILIYKKPDANTLRLIRLGSHSALGL